MKIISKHLNKRPTIGKAPVCVRFHTKGFCFNDCVNKNTHTSSQDLPTSTKKEYTNFIKVCRSWSTGNTPLYEVPLNKIRAPPPDLSSKLQTSSKTRKSTFFFNGNDSLEVFSLSKIPSYTLHPSVPPILSPSKDVLAMFDSTNLVMDILGKFDIEHVFHKKTFLSCEVAKTYSFIKLQKVRSTFYFILLYNIYLHIYLY